MRLRHLFAGTLLWAACAAWPAQAEPVAEDVPLKDWAVGILAADWRDSEGAPIEAFENARRDLARAFADVGFDADNITQLSLRPEQPGGAALRSDEVFTAFEQQAQSAQAGCLLYFTSHGVPEGMVLGGEGLLSPAQLNGLVGQWCGERPTVVVVSACYSGVFVPVLAAPNRLVMTAARSDRSSFGCGAGAIYPVFDNCVLDSLTSADDFVHLARLTRQCVTLREREQRLWPPSEPQAQIGTDVDDLFVFLNFERPAP
ncbi:putative lipoprotein [Hyphomonas neptunium ATCC 15444]|uniref:Putative lipoprotein n=2 Tax=Hyphomonas TaxID=85 RepID=Q0C2A9_HYPNA|nr:MULTISPECIES: C13 family peptidase [Hyphomonas]ABI77283.1 putative lipoprotein [Hyphomonas neptunium ATCC 15444]KCZ93152.1 putative lipoprotein [Hyphomonas hirschiana VP5]